MFMRKAAEAAFCGMPLWAVLGLALFMAVMQAPYRHTFDYRGIETTAIAWPDQGLEIFTGGFTAIKVEKRESVFVTTDISVIGGGKGKLPIRSTRERPATHAEAEAWRRFYGA